MFDNNVFIKGTCKNIMADHQIIGFELQTHITYYRAIPLSMVNDIKVKLDGTEILREQIRCSVDQEDWFTLDEMQTVTSYKWEYGKRSVGGQPQGGTDSIYKNCLYSGANCWYDGT